MPPVYLWKPRVSRPSSRDPAASRGEIRYADYTIFKPKIPQVRLSVVFQNADKNGTSYNKEYPIRKLNKIIISLSI